MPYGKLRVDKIENSNGDQFDLSHGSLVGVDDSGAHEATSIATTALSGLGLSASDVQSVLGTLGTAAKSTAQTLRLDTTDNALMIVGAFGLGADSIPTTSNVDDTDMVTGIYRPTSGASGDLPSNNSGSVLIHIRTTSTIQSQLFLQSSASTPRMFRRNYSSDAWGDWVESLDSNTSHNDIDGRDSAGSHPATAISTTALSNLGLSTSTVQSVLSNLKNGALSAVQDFSSDNTDGAIMTVGAFGLGSSSIPSISDVDDTDFPTGIYRVSGGASGDLPSSNSGCVLIHVRTTDTIQAQIFLQSSASTPKMYRRNYGNGAWGSWVESLDSTVSHNEIGNRSASGCHPATAISTAALSSIGEDASTVQVILSKLREGAISDVQSSSTDNTDGSLLTVGAFGLGSDSIPTVSDVDDTDLPTGIYRPSGASGDLPSNNSGSVLIHVRTTDTIHSQLFMQSAAGSPRMYRRNYSGGAWGSWVTNIDTGNAEADMISVDDIANLGVTDGNVQDAFDALGTAATETVQTSTTDDTQDRLMIQGAWGLGSTAINSLDWDGYENSGFYYATSGASGDAATGNSGSSYLNINSTGEFTQQMAFASAIGSPRTYRRSRTASGWGSWVTLWDSGNLSFASTAQAEAATSTTTMMSPATTKDYVDSRVDDDMTPVELAGEIIASTTTTLSDSWKNYKKLNIMYRQGTTSGERTGIMSATYYTSLLDNGDQLKMSSENQQLLLTLTSNTSVATTGTGSDDMIIGIYGVNL